MRLLLAALLISAACGGPAGLPTDEPVVTPNPLPIQWTGDPALHGVLLTWNSEVTYRIRPDTQDRVRRVLELTAQHFGRDPSTLAGLHIAMQGFAIVGPDTHYAGWYDQASNTATVSWAQARCVEDLLIPHEVLHYWIHDYNHESPLWATLGQIQLERGPDCG